MAWAYCEKCSSTLPYPSLRDRLCRTPAECSCGTKRELGEYEYKLAVDELIDRLEALEAKIAELAA